MILLTLQRSFEITLLKNIISVCSLMGLCNVTRQDYWTLGISGEAGKTSTLTSDTLSKTLYTHHSVMVKFTSLTG